MEYFEKIKEQRIKKGWTQERLANELQVSRKSVARWENGWNIPALIYAQKMAELFEISLDELMGTVTTKHTEGAQPSPHLKGLLILYCTLTVLPIVIIQLGKRVMSFLLELFRNVGSSPSDEFFSGTSFFDAFLQSRELLFSTIYWIAVMCALLLLAGWIAKLVDIFESTNDKYRRFLAYRKWRIGLVFLFASSYTALFDVTRSWWTHGYIFSFKLISGFCVGFWLMLLFDTLFRKFAKTKFLAGQNFLLIKLNRVFIVIGCIILFLFAVFLIVGQQEKYLVFTLFQLLCVMTAAAYFLAIAVLLGKQAKRKN